MINYGNRLLVDRSNYRNTQIKNADEPELKDGEILMRLDKFAYTSNNTTYAVVGDLVGYWKFFPVPENGMGIIPCWGFADVIASKNDAVEVGGRYYGYYPMGSHLIVQPDKISPRGFTDVAAHRVELPVIYNQYINSAADPLYKQEMEDYQALFRPLFTTSFLIHDQYKQHEFYNSRQIILTSASSKTALGLASCLSQESVKVIGLTSKKNIPTVEGSGYYDEVYSYEDITNIEQSASSYVDFAGNHNVQLSLQKHLEEHLTYICLVGIVHWEEQKGVEPLPQKGTFFFAPTYAAKRIKELGFQEFGLRLSKQYMKFVKDASKWLQLKYHKGGPALQEIHQNMTDGKINPSEGHIVNI